MDKNYDVAIIGAGPAGTSCALALRNSGLKVALIDKSTFPRDKTCGDAIPGPSLKFLKELRKEFKLELQDFEEKHQIKSSVLYMPNGESLQIDWVTDAYNSQRIHFDDLLLQQVKKHAKVAVYEGIKIKTIKREAQKIYIQSRDLQFSIICDMVIGCDGANSTVSRSLGAPPPDQLSGSVALSARYENVKASNEANEFYLLKNFPGYFWIFPLGKNNYNVGFGTTKPSYTKSVNLRKYFQEIITTDPVLSKKFADAKVHSELKGFKLPIGGKKINISGERFLLTGDAANLIDPLSGHGIDKAIKSGMLAAQQIEKCFQQKNFTSAFNTRYDAAVFSIYQKELRRNFYLMKIMIHFPFLLRMVFPILKYNKNLFHKYYYVKKKFTTVK